jgi:hypothetical protein
MVTNVRGMPKREKEMHATRPIRKKNYFFGPVKIQSFSSFLPSDWNRMAIANCGDNLKGNKTINNPNFRECGGGGKVEWMEQTVTEKKTAVENVQMEMLE